MHKDTHKLYVKKEHFVVFASFCFFFFVTGHYTYPLLIGKKKST